MTQQNESIIAWNMQVIIDWHRHWDRPASLPQGWEPRLHSRPEAAAAVAAAWMLGEEPLPLSLESCSLHRPRNLALPSWPRPREEEEEHS